MGMLRWIKQTFAVLHRRDEDIPREDIERAKKKAEDLANDVRPLCNQMCARIQECLGKTKVKGSV